MQLVIVAQSKALKREYFFVDELRNYFNKLSVLFSAANAIFIVIKPRNMKVIFALLLSFPFISLAQDCAIKKQVDPYSKEAKLTTGFFNLGGGMGRVSLSIDANKTDIEFIFSVNDGREGKCFDNNSIAVLLYEGGKLKGNFKNSSTMNCEGLFTITFRNVATTPTALKNLAVKKVLSIKLQGNNKDVTEIILKEEEQALFQKFVSCLTDESKTLLKTP
jgi:hypothetical protein